MPQDSNIIKLQKHRRNIQLNQIKSILSDFYKTKFKCVELAKILDQHIQKQQFYNNLQKSAIRKMDLLDLTGLVNFKNQLVKASTELFQIQRQLKYKKQKKEARKWMKDQIQNDTKLGNNQIQCKKQDTQKQRLQQKIQNLITQIKKQQESYQVKQKSKNLNLQIPLYRTKNQSNQNKIDRISKYIASLKRNIKLNSQTPGYKWKIKQFLLEDQTYLKLISDIQNFRMSQQELDEIYCRILSEQIRKYLQKVETLETNSKYKVVKIYKTKKNIENNSIIKDNLGNQKQIINNQSLKSVTKQKQIQNIETIKNLNQVQQFKKQNISQKNTVQMKALQDFDCIKKQIQKSNQTYFEMLSKINETVQIGSLKINVLRQKRKKKTAKDNDIWDQLDKI